MRDYRTGYAKHKYPPYLVVVRAIDLEEIDSKYRAQEVRGLGEVIEGSDPVAPGFT